MVIDNARLFQEVQTTINDRESFLATVSHDLKNPLATVKGLAQFMHWRLSTGRTTDLAPIVEALDGIQHATLRMATLIEELVDIAHLQSGKPLELDHQVTDLVPLTRQAVAQHQQTTPRHQFHVRETAARLLGVWDAARLERVLGNLLSNAVKYSPDGGDITVTLARDEDAGGAWAVLTVGDQGVGIPADDLPHIFTRFHRASNVVGRIAGTGLGMAAARHLVEQHGGTIAVTSQEGQGSAFTVRLPLARRPPA
jgi:signal transduction histidine kinase